MKKKKKSTNEKADQFLAGLGTAGGAIGYFSSVNWIWWLLMFRIRLFLEIQMNMQI